MESANIEKIIDLLNDYIREYEEKENYSNKIQYYVHGNLYSFGILTRDSIAAIPRILTSKKGSHI